MKVKFGLSLVLVVLGFVAMSYNLPEGWAKGGTQPDKYEMGTDPGSGHKGANAATIKSITRDLRGSGMLLQNVSADNYKGKRVRLTGNLRSADLDKWAGLWVRIDGKNTKQRLAFDDMADRPVKGTSDWVKCKIVLDVPATAANISYGAVLNGSGQIWFDNLKFDVVSNSMPTTDKPVEHKAPTNLNFRK